MAIKTTTKANIDKASKMGIPTATGADGSSRREAVALDGKIISR
jgi:hypothetical protein